ncbi:MAG: LolA-related protein [Arenicellales bacterium]
MSTLRTLLILQALMAISVTAHAAGWDIERLMHDLAQVRSDHASFIEKKSIAMLEKPVVSSGELFYIAPDHLEKRTLKPKPESMVLDGETLVIEHGHKKRRLELQDHPQLAAFIDSIRDTLAGDRRALEHHYQLSLGGTADYWTLQLFPVGKKAQEVVKQIQITGTGHTLRSIEITQADGDSSLMLIEKSTKQ